MAAANLPTGLVQIFSVNPTDSTKETPGGNFTLVATTGATNTGTGTITVEPIANAVATVVGESATASFDIVAVDAVSGSGAVTGVFINSLGGTNLLSGNVGAGSTTPAALANAVVANIIATQAVLGVSALATGGTVTVTLPVGSQYNDYVLQVTVNNGIAIDNCYIVINVGSTGYIEITSIEPILFSANILAGIVSSSGLTTEQFVAAVITDIATGASGYIGVTGATTDTSVSLYISRSNVSSSTASDTVSVTWETFSSSNGTVGAAFTNANFKAVLTVSSVSSAVLGSTTIGNQPTNSVTAKPKGGVGPYIYQWSYYSGSEEIKITSPTSKTTNFVSDIINVNSSSNAFEGYQGYPVGGTVQGKFVCTVTDQGVSPALQATTPPVTVVCAYVTAFVASPGKAN